ncbi:hypothetical protein PHJA_001474200 [Phtheirospermum japonicum]|uniref:Uncharacterized protein n=1 Tax=Phtheirospermum japonicum TaxID=374723 RepID=A0A830C8E1_9LAMI|nr:hypothetical protein PHJA_001474200 [Phtheirospermum japonicum]
MVGDTLASVTFRTALPRQTTTASKATSASAIPGPGIGRAAGRGGVAGQLALAHPGLAGPVRGRRWALSGHDAAPDLASAYALPSASAGGQAAAEHSDASTRRLSTEAWDADASSTVQARRAPPGGFAPPPHYGQRPQMMLPPMMRGPPPSGGLPRPGMPGPPGQQPPRPGMPPPPPGQAQMFGPPRPGMPSHPMLH